MSIAFLEIDLGAATRVGLVDIVDIASAGADASDGWWVEYSTDNSSWTQFADKFDLLGSETFTRRASLAPGEDVTARYWRLVADDALSGRTIAVDAVQMWQESEELSAARGFGFSYSTETDYAMVLTDRAIEVYDAGVHVGSVYSPYTSAQVAEVTRAQSLDTLLQFHEDVEPWRVFRQGDGSEWDSRAQSFDNVPQIRFSDATYTNGTNEKQEVLLLKMTSGTDRFNLKYGGKVSASITYDGDNSTTAGNIEAALEGIEDVGSGNVSVSRTATNTFTVEFINDLGQQPIALMSYQFLGPGDGDEIIDVSKVVDGEFGGEPIMSAARGWPSCGTFYQSRLALAGFKGRKATLAFSVLSDFFDLDLELEGSDGGLLLPIDNDQMKAIRQVNPGNHFQIFTDDGEFWISDRVIAKGQIPNFALGPERGIWPGLDVAQADDNNFYVPADGKSVRAFVFEEASQRYRALNASRLSAHLIASPTGWATIRRDSSEGADRVFLANADGSAAVYTLATAEDFAAWVPWGTQGGEFVDFIAEGGRTLYAIVERTVDGQTGLRLEIYDPAALYDAHVAVSEDDPVSEVSGLDHLEGETVELWLDGRPYGSAAVASGAVALPVAASEIEVGLNVAWRAETMDLVMDVGGTTRGSKSRVHSVHLLLEDTGSIAVGANGEEPREILLRSTADAFKPLGDILYTGPVEIDGLMGYARENSVVITQTIRSPATVRAFTMEGRTV